MSALVFGFGSLVAEPGAVPAELRGWRRWWGVAMDNAETIPGYKLYRAPDGSRPDVCVAFVDIEPRAGSSVSGACLPVDSARLAALDHRERSYERVEVTGAVPGFDGQVWAYVGRDDARERLRAARAAGRAVIAADYARTVAALIAPDLPVLELSREDVPG